MESKFPYPRRFFDHPVILMIMVLKAARRQGLKQLGEEKTRLHLPHYGVLALLDENGPMSQKEVAERLDIDPSDLVSFIDRLEQEHCVERQPDKRDRRRHSLAVTEAGREFLKLGDARVARLNEALFERLSEAERGQFEELLRKLVR